MRVKALLFIAFLVFSNSKCVAQTNYNIDPKWDNYYNNYPSGIVDNHRGSDFINVIDKVSFIPNMRELKGDQQLIKRVILMLSPEDLNQMNITGNYYSRTIKHYDYFELYNMTYNKISKETWDRYAPYLLPLMDIDGTVSLK
ncbi:hypothetical protein [Flavobacterium sp. W22_SRS_FP1]|uniref:hypothetical protein n=1 Tax=Flavobacterium sp. W22_SRS_FP1 TaxID=3240276 RepID=UPI003F8E00E8